MSASPLLPLEVRLATLEHQTLGSPSPQFGPSSLSSSPTPMTRRVRSIQESLERAGSSDESLKRLIAGYEQYLPLLGLPDHSTEERPDDPPRVKEQDLLPDATRLAMVLGSADDINAAERDLREIDVLRSTGVEGSGDLEDLISLKGGLIRGYTVMEGRTKGVDGARKEVGLLLARYNEFTSTVSDMFLDLHRRLLLLEDGVERLERAKRKELAGRF